jgi:GrpB-like predicted nucleotidyltransferase (UPF0157 family)
MDGIIEEIWIATDVGQQQVRSSEITVNKGKGIVGDRYYGKSSKENITLIEKSVIDEFNREFGLNIQNQDLRRNLIVSGISLNDYVGKHFAIGKILAKGTELCEPCTMISKLIAQDRADWKEILKWLTHKGGLRAEILQDGHIKEKDLVGDGLNMRTTKKVVVVDYNEDWPKHFSQISQKITETIGSLILGIEHVGSTSVPDLMAKPIIDIDIVIESWGNLAEVISGLASIGYIHQGNLGIKDREAFKKEFTYAPFSENGPTIKHNLYVCSKDGRELKRHITFRDCLRNSESARIEYQNLKVKLAQQFPTDVDSYCDGKTELIERLLKERGYVE